MTLGRSKRFKAYCCTRTTQSKQAERITPSQCSRLQKVKNPAPEEQVLEQFFRLPGRNILILEVTQQMGIELKAMGFSSLLSFFINTMLT